MAAGSKIAVEITGNSSDLQAALDKAADALKTLAGTVAKTAEASVSSGDDIVKSNQRVGSSFGVVADAAKKSSTSTTASFSYQTDSIVSGSGKQLAALDKLDDGLAGVAAAADRSAAAVIAAIDRQTASLATLATRSKTSADASSAAVVKLGKDSTIALAAVAAGSVYAAAKFQTATTQFVTQAGVGVKASQDLAKGILSMASQVGQTPDQLAGGMYHIVSSLNNLIPPTQRVSTELGILRVAAEGAAVGNSNMTQTTYVLSALMNALGETTIPQAHKSMAELNAIVGAGDMHMQDLVDAMSTGIVPVAKTFGTSLQSMGAALDVLADKGVPAQQAATKLRMALTEMGAPTKMAAGILETMGLSATQAISSSEQMTAALEKAGVSTTQIAQDLAKPDGILVALQDLKTHLENSGLSASGAAATISRAFGGIRGATVIETLYQSLDKLQKKYEQIGTTSGQFNSDFAQTQNTLTFQLHQTEAGIEAIGVTIGTWLIPKVEAAISGLRSFIDWLGQNKVVAEALGIAIASVLGGAIAAFVYTKAAAFVTALVTMGRAVGTLGTQMLTTAGLMKGAEATMVTDAEGTATAIDGAMLATGIGAALTALGIAAALLLTHWKSVMAGMKSAVADMVTGTRALLNTFISLWNNTLGIVLGKIGQIQGAATSANMYAGVSSKSVVQAFAQTYGLHPGETLGQAQKALAATAPNSTVVKQTIAELKASGYFPGGVYNPTAALQAQTNSNVTSFMKGSSSVTQWASIAQAMSKQTGIPVSVLLGQIQQESGGNPAAVSSAGAFGLSQFMPGTAAQFGVMPGSSSTAVTSQISGQAQYLQQLKSQYGSITKALEAYYGGAGGVANPNELVKGGPTPAQYASSVLTNSVAYNKYNVAGTGTTGGGGSSTGGGTSSDNPNIAKLLSEGWSLQWNWQAKQYDLMSPKQATALEAAWYKLHPHTQEPSGPATATQLNAAATLGPGGARFLYQGAGGVGLTAVNALTGGIGGGAATLGAALAKSLAADKTAGSSLLGKLTSATGASSVSEAASDLKGITQSSMDTLVKTLNSTHVASLQKLATDIKAEYKTALANQAQLVAAAAYQAMLTGVQNAASLASSRASASASLYGAGVSLGVNSPADQANAAALAATGGYHGAGNVASTLPGIIASLEGGTASYSALSAYFGSGSSELGVDFGALASGGLNASDSATMQSTVAGLLANLASALTQNTTAVTDNTESMNTLLQQQNTQLGQKLALNMAQTSVLAGFIPSLPHFASGGPVMDDGLAFLHAGEHVVPAAGTLVKSGRPEPGNIELHQHYHGNAGALMSLIDQRIQHPDNIYKVSQQIGRRTNQLTGAPGGARSFR